MSNLSERDKKFLMVGGVCVIIYILIEWVMVPLYDHQKRSDGQIESKTGFIEKYYEILNSKEYYQKKKKGNETLQANLTRFFLEEEKPSLAAARLQKILESHAQQTSVSIISTRTEKTKYVERLLAIPVEITVRSRLSNLSRLISQIENDEHLLMIEKISIKRTGKQDTPEDLKSKLLVLGFVQQLEPEKPKKS